MKNKKMKNPLMKRIPKELLGDWRKYLVVSLFLILTIGFVSGMYVANESMMTAADTGVSKYKLEDGHFELNKKADKKLISAIQSGKKANIKQYYLDKAKQKFEKEFKKKFTKKFNAQFGAQLAQAKQTGIYQAAYDKAYDKAYQEAYDKAWAKVLKKINKKYADAEEKYELNAPDFKAVPVKIYETFYRNEEEDYNNDGTSDGTIRIYAKTDNINQACLMEGNFPSKKNEIAIDRMHADNVGIKVNDIITVGGQSYKVVGLIAYVNYSTLHEKSTDLMFDALKFDVAMVTEQGFERLNQTIHYTYAWKYNHTPKNEQIEKKQSDHFMKALLTQTVVSDNEIEDYVPAYANPAINFATEDMGSDEAMGGVLLYILIIIIAFIFAITISNTITKESSTIGTLRALGYTKGELIRHYISMPVIVTFLASCIGNVLGYSLFKNIVVSMYYNSYSLPTYETIWNSDAFFKTTLVPVILMFVVNLIVITKMIQHSPLQFLRHDLKKSRRKRAIQLPAWKFLNRFRLRIMLQNMVNYVILFIGIFFIMVMLAMAVGMPDTLNFYKENTSDMMFAKYQYILKSYEDENGNVLVTKNTDAEKFNTKSLQRKSDILNEEISVYGISDNSSYIKIANLKSLKENEVYISASFRDKYDLQTGDTITLDEKYENKQYHFKVAGIYDRCQTIAVFMPIKNYQTVFDLDKKEFSGYISDSKITDIKGENIATVITERDITKMCDQLDHSMGSYMEYFQFLCVILSAVLIYLLTKLIIEKNETAISMTKILGYENKEIASLYLFSTTIVLIVSDAICVVLGTLVMRQAWKVIMYSYSGWYGYVIEPLGYIKMFSFVLIGYFIVMILDFKRIKKIPMEQALKNVE
ncbi:ABC transporter permease [Velocimicrobium porci]|uniref:FtsX-like permease family protein n=1 Tax=Velocimicrobium porci TaxID=2606634 RepID=A0A6L5XY04_9FIRM|nr:ABC transporter permease [Velocimicrobium porci]MSS63489.1 FtsX-like permease family protein [Velocimicrobium porci]